MEAPQPKPLVIAASPAKTVLLILGSAAFVIVSAILLSLSDNNIASQNRFNSPILVHSVAVVGILFFGACGVAGVIRLTSKRPGLILDQCGIEIFYFRKSRKVPWEDIAGFGEYSVQRQKQIIILLKDPNHYLQQYTGFARWWAQANIKLAGSPLYIPHTMLKIKYQELLNELDQRLAIYHAGNMQ